MVANLEYRLKRAITFDLTVSPLQFLQGFREVVFFGVVMEWLLVDEDSWSVAQEYRLKRAITFGPTVGSRLNFYRGFQRLFLLGKLWNRC